MSQMFLSGSEATAHGARLARVQVISAYPISPNVNVIATLSEMVADGELDAEFVNAEGEHSAASIITGAAAAGSRAYTASCGQGIAFMHEVLWMASGMALPIVLAVTSRGIGIPQTLACDFSDLASERDASILQFYTEDAQEVVDSTIIAYKVGEHPDVLLPSFVSVEGYRLSHTYEAVDIPDQETVDEYLPPYEPKHTFLDPKYPMMLGTGADYSKCKMVQHEAMLRSRQVIKDAFKEFGEKFGRHYDMVESYRVDDADMVVVAMGSMAGVIREVVDDYRENGIKMGMLKIRIFRPFPEEEIRQALKGVEKILVIDRFNSPGSHGVLYTELRSALFREKPLVSSFVIFAADLYKDDVQKIVDMALDKNDEFEEWYIDDFDDSTLKASGWDHYQALCQGKEVEREDLEGVRSHIAPGTSACQGCAPLLATRHIADAMGDNAVCIIATGCIQTVTAGFPLVGWNMATAHTCFTNVASTASGVEAAFRQQGKDTKILVLGGDGGLADIGFQPLSGAIERGHDITYVCYDNEAYMNTGVQRSSTTSYLAKTKTTPAGKTMHKKDISKIMEAHGIYVATALPCFPGDLVKKIEKAKSIKGPAFVHVLCPCPTGWDFDPAIAVKLSRLAFETGSWVLYEYEDGVRTISRLPKERKPIEEYIKPQRRFSHLTPEQIVEMQREVDRNFEALTS